MSTDAHGLTQITLDEANKLWFEFKPIKGIKFGLNDSVEIISNEYCGEFASVISLISVNPPIYLIEFASGAGDIAISELELKSID